MSGSLCGWFLEGKRRLWNWRNGDTRMERTLFWAAGVYDQRLGFIPACQWIGGGGTVLSRGYVDHAAGKALARTEYANGRNRSIRPVSVNPWRWKKE
mgnify:CR=1 FL=1